LIGAIDAQVLVALIGTPAALITAVGTIWVISRRSGQATVSSTGAVAVPLGSQPVPVEQPNLNNGRTNGHRYVTHAEMRELAHDMRGEMNAIETRQNAKLDLIVTLLKDR
jgi:hypothetical protein